MAGEEREGRQVDCRSVKNWLIAPYTTAERIWPNLSMLALIQNGCYRQQIRQNDFFGPLFRRS